MKSYRTRFTFREVLMAFVKKVLIAVGIILVLALATSVFLSYKYSSVVKVFSFISLIIGALSVLGGMGTTYNPQYNWHKSTTRMTSSTREDVKLLQGSYSFCIFMSLAGAIVYFLHHLVKYLGF